MSNLRSLTCLLRSLVFDGKGFEMIGHMDKYFNPSGAVDSLGHIFDLINIKQSQDKSIITLRAQFSRIFALSKWGE